LIWAEGGAVGLEEEWKYLSGVFRDAQRTEVEGPMGMVAWPILMNAELVMTGQARIIIPTSYRTDYLGALEGPVSPRSYDPADPDAGLRTAVHPCD
jgi:hypothetical protein